MLDAAHEQVLTLVCAPAGYGKTTALSDWFATLDGPRVWVSLGEGDDDPRRLLAHLLAALEQLWPAATWPAQQALLGGSDVVETVVPLIAEAIAREADESELVVVLDDYHLLTDAICHQLLTALADALPVGARIVVASRTHPPQIGLARRRAAHTIAELGAAELAFVDEEAERLLNGSLRLRLTSEQVATIQARVEGWPAGLSLVASTLRDDRDRDGFITALPRSHERIAGYLMEEVLDALPPRIRDFLSRTSVLERMNVSLCEAVLEDPDAGAVLDEARRANLFLVSVDDGDAGPWVRCHGLLADLLERDLRRRDPDAPAVLHRRAALWFQSAGMPEEAIDHATAAGDGRLAAQILHDRAWWRLLIERRYATLRRAIARMPPERGELGPFCAVVDALSMALEGADLRLVAERLDALEPMRDAPGVAEILDGLRVSPFHGDVPRSLAAGWRLWNDDPSSRVRQAGIFSTVLWFAGERAAIRAVLGPYMGQTDRPTQRSWELAALALCAADEDELDAAERYAREAVAIMQANGSESALEAHFAYVALAEALRRRGKLDDAYEQIASALRATEKQPASLYHAFALVFRAQLDLSSRNRRTARAHAEAARRIVDQHADVGTLEPRLARIEVDLDRPTARELADSEPTPAERRVLELLPTDLTRTEIAARLGLATETVKSHTRRLYRRLGARTRDEAIAIAHRRGLL